MGTYINKPKRNYNPKRQQNDIDKKKRAEIYATAEWRKLREAKIMDCPLCEVCEAQGLTALAQDVHHLNSFSRYTGNERLAVAFDYNNLISICKRCHWEFHHGFLRGTTTKEEAVEKATNHNKPL